MSDADDQGIRVKRGRRAPFKQLPDDVIDDETISPEAKVTYWYLKRIADFDDDNAIVSMGKIANKLGRSRSNRRAARSWVDELVTAGWVDTYQRKSDFGGDLAGEFIVHDIRDQQERGKRWTPGGGGLRIKGQRVDPDPGGGGSDVTQGGGQTCTGEGVAADPLSSRSVSTQDVSSSKTEEDPDGSSSSTTPHGAPDTDPHEEDHDLLGDVLDLSKARGERPPRTNSRASTTGVAQDPGTSENSSAAGRDQPGDRDDVEVICLRIRDGMIRNGFKPPTITQAWRREARLLLDRDGRVLDKVLNLIDWCQDHHFWKTNIKSTSKFREQYDTLRLQALNEYQRSNERALAGDRWGSGPRKQRNPVDQSVYDVDPFQQAAQEQATRAKAGAS